MATRLDLDPSRPYQLHGNLLAIWLPRGRGRDDRAPGLLAHLRVCTKLECECSEAAVAALRIDDHLAWVKEERKHLKMSWHTGDERPPATVHQLTLDFVGGRVINARGGALPPEVAPFFRAPVPAWVLDDIYAAWQQPRASTTQPWAERALEHWRPGAMLSWAVVGSDLRPELFVVDGKTYCADFLFGCEPNCTCTQSRFSVLEVDQPTPLLQRWTEIAGAEVGADMQLHAFVGSQEQQAILRTVWSAWQERSGNPRKRFAEVRQKVQDRGAILHQLWEAEHKTPAPAAPTAKAEIAADSAAPVRAAMPAPAPAGPAAIPAPAAPIRAAVPAPAPAGPIRALVSAPAPAAPIRALVPEQWPATAQKVGRNDPCPCGSGKKYKRCCGA